MNLRDILREKGTAVLTIEPTATLDDVVQKLVRHNCGSLLVCEQTAPPARPRMVGIVTERDILRACATGRAPLAETLVTQVMVTKVVTASPADRVEDVMGLMTVNRIRHLPVLEGGELVGLVSIGDIVKAQHDQFAFENHYLKSYIQG